jgi:hypothetical protein
MNNASDVSIQGEWELGNREDFKYYGFTVEILGQFYKNLDKAGFFAI